jgi:hypothetical protein
MSDTTEKKTRGQLMKETLGMFLNPQFASLVAEGIGEDFTYENGKKISKKEFAEKFNKAFEMCSTSVESFDYAESNKNRYYKTQTDIVNYLKNEFLPLTHGMIDPKVVGNLQQLLDLGMESLEKVEAGEAEAPEAQSS